MDNQLKTFITVADNRSFNKAANALFISPPAVIKQINSLEKTIKVKLFNRSHSGISLTKAGEAFYLDAQKLMAAYDQSISHAQDLSKGNETIKIGAGPLAPGLGTSNLWLKVSNENPNLTFEFIPCSCSLGDFNEFLAGINKEFDLVSSVYDINLLKKYNLDATQLDTTPLKLSIPGQNKLSQKESIDIADLDYQTVALPVRGEFSSFDQVRDVLEKRPKIEIQNIDGFDLSILNECVKEDWILCSAEDWQTAHPMLSSKTVNWNFKVPFGLVYGKSHKPIVDKVIKTLKN